MRVEIYHFNQKEVNGKLEHDVTPTHLGYAEVEVFDAEYIWDLCNWSCWTDKKPYNLFSELACCNHGLYLIDPKTQEHWLSLSSDWLIGDKELILEYVIKHKNDIWWN